MRSRIAVVLVCALAIPARADKFDGGIPGSFLEFGSGARPLGMGSAFAAVADGPQALLWNPGGLGLPSRNAASFTHITLYEGASLDELAYAHSFNKPFGLGFSVLSFQNNGLTTRDANNVETGSFDDSRRAYSVGWGVQPAKGLSFGFTHKLIQRRLSDASSSAVDMDAGVSASRGRYRMGFFIRNLMGADLSRDGGSDTLPRVLHVGGAATILEPLLASAEVVTRAGVTDVRLGVEYDILRVAALRAGWDGAAPTFGGSWKMRNVGIDYALSKHSVLGLSHRVTLGTAFGASATNKALARAEWRDTLYAKAGSFRNARQEKSAQRRERARKVGELLDQAARALDAGDFKTAHQTAVAALQLEPSSSAARALADKAAMSSVAIALATSVSSGSVVVVSSATADDLRNIPKYKTSRKQGLAVIIGIERYRDLRGADFAVRDGRSAKEYFQFGLGIPEENIVTLLDERAGLADFKTYLGAWLQQKASADSEVFIYFSGHGTPDPATGAGYVVPYDASPLSLQQSGFSLAELYASLAKLPMKRALVFLDACFSGAGGPRTVLAEGTRPIVPVVEDPVLASGKIAVFSASAGSQISGTAKDKAHGLFSYYVLKGLQGAADSNGDKKVSLTELYGYVLPNVVIEARKDRREQEPRLMPAPDVADPWGDEPLVQLE